MALFKCKMCGGDLEIVEGASIAECEYCGTKQTVPKAIDENLQNLYNRANTLRIKSEFDKAEKLYEKIIQADSTQSEAYWGLILCKYGIEYVDDPATFKKVPTCHRASFESIVADEDYKSALENADMSQRAIYEEQAKEIDRIQKDILALAQKEENYDVFICYKETGADGRRTQDSVIANDIYYQLTQEGFKVFYAAITLEGKLGSAYEPIIFAALNSAKVMLAIGTKPEYFNAVWVKNEWSRYLKIIKSDRSKLLIPCYRDMDAYELPEEFAHLQAQDMSKIGFINDVVRGIKKVIVKNEPKATVVKETVVTSSGPSVEPLLKRVFMFLEDEEWDSAKEYAEKVLDIDPENAKAYLAKFLAEFNLKNRSVIVDMFADTAYIEESADFQKAIRFADDALREELNGYIKAINDRNEHDRIQKIYDNARSKMNLYTYAGYSEAAKLLKTIKNYLDSEKLIEDCLEKAEVYRKNEIYAEALAAMERYDITSVESAIKKFQSIIAWKDSENKIAECNKMIADIKEQQKQEKIAQEERKKKVTKVSIISGSILAVVIIFVVILTTVIIPSNKYSSGEKFIESGDYVAAMGIFKDLDYKDSYDRYCEAFNLLKSSYRETAEEYLNSGDKINAAIYFIKAGDPIKAKEVYDFNHILQAGEYSTSGIMSDGTFKFLTNHEYDHAIRNMKDLHNTKNIIRLFNGEDENIVGVDTNGNLCATRFSLGSLLTDANKNYSNIKQIIANYNFTCYLTDAGDVFCKYRDEELYSNFSSWKDIKEIYGYGNDIFGIDYDGNVYTSNEARYHVSSMKNVRKIGIKSDIVFGITNDGKIIENYYGNYSPRFGSEILGYTDVVDAIYISPYLVVLHEDGTVSLEYVDSKEYTGEEKLQLQEEFASVAETWDGIVSIQQCAGGLIGIRYDGTAKYVSTEVEYLSNSYSDSKYRYDDNSEIKNAVETWTDIVWITGAKTPQYGDDLTWVYAVGIKSDGSVVSTGNGEYYTTEEDSRGDYYDKYHSGGTYHLISDWKLW